MLSIAYLVPYTFAAPGFVPPEDDTRLDAVGLFGGGTFTLIDPNTILFAAHSIFPPSPPQEATFRRHPDGSLGIPGSVGSYVVSIKDVVIHPTLDLAMGTVFLPGDPDNLDPVPHISPIGVATTATFDALETTTPAISAGINNPSTGSQGTYLQIAAQQITGTNSRIAGPTPISGSAGQPIGDSGSPVLVLNAAGDYEVVDLIGRIDPSKERLDAVSTGNFIVPTYPTATPPTFSSPGPGFTPTHEFTSGTADWTSPSSWTNGQVPELTPNVSAVIDEHFAIAELHDGELAEARVLTIGKSALSALFQYGGTVNQTSFSNPNHDMGSVLILGHDVGGAGLYRLLDDDAVYNGRGIIVGYHGIGSFSVENGGDANVEMSVILGYEQGSSGTLEISGLENTDPNHINLNARSLNVGLRGTGTYIHESGKASFSMISMGEAEGSVGTLTQTAGLIETDILNVGLHGKGSVIIDGSGATLEVADELNVGVYDNSASEISTLELKQGQIVSTGNVRVGVRGSGEVFHRGGNVDTQELTIGGSAVSANYTQESGALIANTARVQSGTLSLVGGTRQVNELEILSGGTLELGQTSLGINGGLTVHGTLSYKPSAGPTTSISQGFVEFGSGATINGASNVSFELGANTLLLLPQGYSPASSFQTFTTAGVSHTLGSTLTLANGDAVIGSGDLVDEVVLESGASLSASTGGSINIANGLRVESGGALDAGNGRLTAGAGGDIVISGSASALETRVESGATLELAGGSLSTDVLGFLDGSTLYISSTTSTVSSGAGILIDANGASSLVVGFDKQLPGTSLTLGTAGVFLGAFSSVTHESSLGQGVSSDFDSETGEWSLSFTNLLEGDADLDGFVGQADEDAVLLNWGISNPDYFHGDLSGDGIVGQADLDAVLLNWGNSVPGAEPPSSPVPEPAALTLLLVYLGGFAARRRG